MSFLEKLLDSTQVEWKTLGEVGEFIRGNGMQKKDFVEVGFPAIHYGQIYTKYGLSANKTFTYVSGNLASKLRKARKNDLLLATTSENDEDVVKPLAWFGEEAAISGDMVLFRHGQNVKYLAYFIQTEIFQEQKRKYITGTKVRRVSSNDLSKILVPIPSPENPEKSLKIQSEIVEVLDNFSALTAELIAELTAELSIRRKQFNYYREQLFNFENGDVEWEALEKVAHFFNGKGHEKDITEDGEYIVVNSKFISTNGRVAKYSNKQICPLFINDILLVMSDLPNGKALAKTFIVDADDRYTLNQRIGGISVKNKNELHPKFLYYFLNRNPQLTKFDNGVDQTNLRKDQILGVQIPILSLTEQTRIVTILDKFDTLISSINEGLPREIELRQQQYEYYRDLLFSFPKSETLAV